jgi:Ca2+-binding RTX toxin-like protein
VVQGTAGTDVITVAPNGKVAGSFLVTVNGVPTVQNGISGRLLLFGLDGTDTLSVSPKITLPSQLNGGNGNDTLTGGAGKDVLIGGAGNDSLNGGAGNDSLTGGVGDDTLDGGTGTDRLVETGDVNFILTQGTATTNGSMTGGLGNDVLVRNHIEAAELTGGNGDNTINAAAFSGKVILRGGLGNDTLIGGSGNALLLGEGGNDSLQGGAGRNILIGGLGTDTLAGGAGDDVLVAGTTLHDNNRAALDALMLEWSQTAVPYATRVKHLLGTMAGGKNGTFLLNATTAIDDGAPDQLTGQAGLDWFLRKSPSDSVTDPLAGVEVLTDLL